jgi:hypothetical protein
MRLAILLISIAGALIMGLIWTVGQTGLSDANAHLCELFSRYLTDIPEDCQASDWIVSIAGYLFLFAVGIAALDIAWIFVTPKAPVCKPKLHVSCLYPKNDGYCSFWYVDVQNIGQAVAKGLRFQLDGIENGPKDPSWKGLYPYDVRPEKIKHLQDWSAVPLAIDRGEQTRFEMFETRLSSDNKFRVVGLDSRKISRLNDTAVEIDPDEKWLLTYKVGAHDIESQAFHVCIDFKDGKPFAKKVD